MESKDPRDCTDMVELRDRIDTLDTALVALLAERGRCIDRAVELKPAEGMLARDEDRVEEVLANVRGHARTRGLDAALVETLWRELIEWSIRRERQHID